MTITTTPQKVKLYAFFDNPPTVFACRVNQTFDTHDMVHEFLYDGEDAYDYTDILPGMTILLGATMGGSEYGITYARKSASSSMIYCGETSEVDWQNDLYVTVLQDWGIWNESLMLTEAAVVYMKYDVAYSDQHTKLKPIPIIGSDRVIRYEGAPVTLAFDSSDSYVPGSTITEHLWICAGAIITDHTTATPSIEIDTPGRYVVEYTCTSALSVSSTTYRTIHVWSDQAYLVGEVTKSAFPPSEVVLASLAGDFQSGGWSFELSILSAATTIRTRSKVIIFAEEWYGNVKESYGSVVGAENIAAIGWVDSEQVSLNVEAGENGFSVKGVNFWLNQVYNFIPVGIEYSPSAPVAWTQMNPLTVDRALWNLIIWRSTVTNCVDVYLTGDTKTATELTAQPGTLWAQIQEIATNAIVATPCCDRYGRIFIEVEAVLLPNSGRSGITHTAAANHDMCESIDVNILSTTQTSQVVLSGVKVTGNDGDVLFSLSRGHIPLHYGTPVNMERLLLSTQTLSNELAGAILEKANVPYQFSFNNLLYNNRLVDICPRQFVTATIEAADNSRGIAYTGHVVVNNINLSFEDGSWSITWGAAPETFSILSTDGDPPGDRPMPRKPTRKPKRLPVHIPTNPNLGLVVISIGGNGLWVMDTRVKNGFGSWYFVPDSVEYGWANFQLGTNGIAYSNLNSIDVINLTPPVVLTIDESITTQAIAAGIRLDTNTYVLVKNSNEAPKKAIFYKLNTAGTGLVRMFTIDNPLTNNPAFVNGSLAFYKGIWYYTAHNDGGTGETPEFYNTYVKINNVFSAEISSYTTPVWQLYNRFIHALSADVQYGVCAAYVLTKMTNNGVTQEAIPTVTPKIIPVAIQQRISCDPTGQYLMIVSGVLTYKFEKSDDYGDTWADITNFPSWSYDGRAATAIVPYVVYNLGSASTWIAVYTGTVYLTEATPTVNYLHMWYTADFGVTWIDISGDLRINTTDTAQVICVRTI